MDLRWTPPTYDGGARVTGYVVEKKEFGAGGWKKVNDFNLPSTEYTVRGSDIFGFKTRLSQITSLSDQVSDLNEGREYEFRVSAVNSAGKGEPSAPTRQVKVNYASLCTLNKNTYEYVEVLFL